MLLFSNTFIANNYDKRFPVIDQEISATLSDYLSKDMMYTVVNCGL